MAIRPKALIPGTLLTASVVTLYTVPSNNTTKVFEVVLCNTSTTQTVGVDLHLVESGGAASAANQLFSAGVGGMNLAPLETRIIGMEQRLADGGTIRAGATVASLVSIRASGDEIA